MDQFICLINLEGKIIDINETAVKYMEETVDEVKGKMFWEGPWWEDETELIDCVKSAVEDAANGETVKFEKQHVNIRGRESYVEFSINHIRGSNGEIIYLMPIGYDVTKTRLQESELRESLKYQTLASRITSNFVKYTELSKAINESIPILGTILGAVAVKLEINDVTNVSASQTFQWQSDVILDSSFNPWEATDRKNIDEELKVKDSFLIYDHKTDNSEISDDNSILANTELLVHGVYCNEALIGKVSLLFNKAKTQTMRNHMPFIGIFTDVLSSTYEKNVLKTALVASKEEAVHANKMKTDFLTNMSHDLRVPLNTIIGMINLALHTPEEEKQRSFIKKAKRSTALMKRVIDDILDLSKIESNIIEIENKPFVLMELLENVIGSLAVEQKSRDVEFVVNIDPSLPDKITGDIHRLEQILNNLLTNAFESTSKGGVQLNVDLNDINVDEMQLSFSVIDSGPSMSITKMQLLNGGQYTSTSKLGEDIGLGLRISQQLVKRLGSDLNVDHVEKDGNVFNFGLTCGYERDKAPTSVISKRKALLYEQNEMSAKVLKGLLEQEGFNVESVQKSSAALAKIIRYYGSENYDYVFVDYRLGDQNGTRLIEEIHTKYSKLANKVVILVNPTAINQALSNFSYMGIKHVLAKPIIKSSLKSIICDTSVEAKKESLATEKPIEGYKILLAEDNKCNQIVAKHILKNAGARIDIVENGEKAIEQLKKEDYDIILMDIQMPVMDGYEASEEIISMKIDTPVIALTANAFKEEREKAFASGMKDFITKPIDDSELVRVISKWIKE